MDDSPDRGMLGPAVRGLLTHPLLLVWEWNWKAAAFSSVIRGALFFLTNRHIGRAHAVKAMVVEATYAAIVGGLAGGVTQRLRHARPRLLTATVVLLALPLIMLTVQAAVHHVAGTPRLRSGLLLSFLFASLATGFNWFAMAHGVFLTGGTQGFGQDLLQLARLFTRRAKV